jgi:hypothetical protein
LFLLVLLLQLLLLLHLLVQLRANRDICISGWLNSLLLLLLVLLLLGLLLSVCDTLYDSIAPGQKSDLVTLIQHLLAGRSSMAHHTQGASLVILHHPSLLHTFNVQCSTCGMFMAVNQ